MTEFGYFKKTIRLPNNVDTKQIPAKFNNGILMIIMPKIVIGKETPIEWSKRDLPIQSKMIFNYLWWLAKVQNIQRA